MVRVECQGPLLMVWLDAPASRNALSDEMVQGLFQALQRAAELPMLRALVLRGAGGHFCAGGDFSRFRELMATPAPREGTDPIAVFSRGFGHLLQAWRNSPLLTLAVVEGAAIGGGCGLAAACDLVWATDTAQFAMPELSLGLPPAQIAPFVANRMGERQALRLMVSGQRLHAHEAQQRGLVDEVVAATELDATLQRWTFQLLRAEPQALRATRAILVSQAQSGLNAALDLAADSFARSLRSGTASEGLAALSDQRPPVWATRS